jgi:hypothetical protein
LCNAEYALAEALTPPPPELIPVILPDVQPEQPLTAVGEEPAAETIEPQEASALGAASENEAAAVVAEFPAKPAPPRRRRKHKSALQTLIEVVAGGLAGCLVAYYGLAFYYGADFAAKGMPILPLPGIESITAPRAAPDAGKQKPPEKKPDKGKPKPANHDESAQTALALRGQTS